MALPEPPSELGMLASMTSLFMVAFLLYRDDKAAAPAVVGKA